jgi:hypothetical protein
MSAKSTIRRVTRAHPLASATLTTLAICAAGMSFGCGSRHIELSPSERVSAESPPEAPLPEPVILDSAPPLPNAPRVPNGTLPDLFDVPAPSDAPEVGCRKIDFLFVIDNSDSMDDEQANLTQSFPGFIGVMQQVLEARDFHIMVVGTGGDREDDDEPTLSAEDCEEVQGAGLPFMTDQQPNLEATFACVAQVGTDGSAIEEPIDSVLQATGAALNAPGRCNAGFLREDAVLVVTFITDEEDRRSEGDPEDWQRILLDVKSGNDDALVVLGLVGDNNVDGGLLGGPCRDQDADGAPRLQEFVRGVDGVIGSVCSTDYTDFFRTAVGSIDGACSDFVPPIIF